MYLTKFDLMTTATSLNRLNVYFFINKLSNCYTNYIILFQRKFAE